MASIVAKQTIDILVTKGTSLPDRASAQSSINSVTKMAPLSHPQVKACNLNMGARPLHPCHLIHTSNTLSSLS